MMRPNPYMLLIPALNFTAADLADNQRGRLSPNQRETLSRQALSSVRSWGLGMTVLGIAGFILQAKAVIWFAGVIMAAIATLAWLSFQADLAGGVRAANGRVILKERLPLPFWSPYYLVIGRDRFPVSREIGHGFTRGHSYRVYYTSKSRTIVSGEVLR